MHPSNSVQPSDVKELFTYQPPSADDASKYSSIREAALSLANVIIDVCPGCADKSAAIRKLRECVMTANASIALDLERE